MQVILDSTFARPGSVPIRGGKKGEFRDWTRVGKVSLDVNFCKDHRNKIEVPDPHYFH